MFSTKPTAVGIVHLLVNLLLHVMLGIALEASQVPQLTLHKRIGEPDYLEAGPGPIDRTPGKPG